MLKNLLLLTIAFLAVNSAQSQPPGYAFQAVSGTYTQLAGGTPVVLTNGGVIDLDDGLATPANAVPIGFTFIYNGTSYTTVRPSANGFATFSTTALVNGTDTRTNTLVSGVPTQRPLVAPLWDDLDMSAGSVSYALTGTTPSRVLTVQWDKAKWDFGAAGPGISFQLKLYETTNVIEFVYSQESSPVFNTVDVGASIGLTTSTAGNNNYWSLQDAGTAPLISSATENNGIVTKPATGQIYRWSPYCAAGANNTTAGGEKISAVAIGTINSNSVATAGYENLAAQNSFIIQAAPVPISISVSNPKATDQAYVWIDFNHNGSFADAGELVYTSPVGVGPYNATLSIPALSGAVLPGIARMRVRLQDTNVPPANNTSCGNSEWGQVEDYTLNINVCMAATFTAQPVSVTVCSGGNATLTAVVTGTFLTYQWQVSTDGGATFSNLTNNLNYAGVNTAILSLTGVTAAMSGYVYRLVVNGACTPANATSNSATLTVNNPASVTQQPEPNKAVCVGSSTSFTAAASGNGLSYQWQASTDGGITFSNLTGATSATLALTNATMAMNGNRYRVLVSSASCGAAVSLPGILTVNPLPVVTIQSSPTLSVQPGLTTYISVGSTPKAASYSWTLNGVSLNNTNSNTLNVNYAGIGTYRATVTDVNGCVSTSQDVVIDRLISGRMFLFPNPNNGSFHVRYYTNQVIGTFQIFNAVGALVYHKEYSFRIITNVEEDLSFPGLPKGFYTVRIQPRYLKEPVSGSFVIQ